MDAEQEYVEAKAAYAVALARLTAAKKALDALPPKPTKWELRDAENKRISDAVWQAYLDGARDYRVLAVRFGRSRGWIGGHIRDILRERRFGPETLEDYRYRTMLDNVSGPWAEAKHSEAWHRVRQMHEEQRMAAEQITAAVPVVGLPRQVGRR